MKWQPYPMLRIAGFFAGGVLLGIYQPDFIPFHFVIALAVVCAILFFAFWYFSNENKFTTYSGALGLLSIFLLGYSRLLFFTDSRNDNHISKINEQVEAYEAIIRSVPQEKAKSWKVEVEVVQIKTVDKPSSGLRLASWKQATGNLLLYVSKEDSSVARWHYGDKILVKGNPQELNPPANPGEFDFKRFLSFKNISHQQFVSVSQVKWISQTSSKGFIYYSHEARAWCMNRINEFVHGEDKGYCHCTCSRCN
jgi:competence protein ComEC